MFFKNLTLKVALILILMQPCLVYSQATFKDLTNETTLRIAPQQFDTIPLSNKIIATAKVYLPTGEQVDELLYECRDSSLIWLGPAPKDSLIAKYRTFSKELSSRQSNKSLDDLGKKIKGERLIGIPSYDYNPFLENASSDKRELDYNGTFARGISVGNNQDLILNSNFNIQLNGKLGGIDVLGAISDNNIPVQPDGNTQQLQEFDRIFIQFSLKENKLIAGDFDLKAPPKKLLC